MKKLAAKLIVVLLVCIVAVMGVVVPAVAMNSVNHQMVQTPSMITQTVAFYPIVDGVVDDLQYTPKPWAVLRGGSGARVDATSNQLDLVHLQSWLPEPNWWLIRRGILIFPTNTLPSDATNISATLSLYGIGKTDVAGWKPDVNVYPVTTASLTSIIPSDYTISHYSIGTPLSTPIGYDMWSTSDWNNFTLSASAVNLTGVTELALLNANYDVANISPVWSNGQVALSTLQCYSSEQGNSYRPKLVVTYTTSVPIPTPTPTPTISISDASADYIFYRDNTGYHALRTEDNTVVSSDPSDFAVMFNRLMSSLTLVHGTTEANTNYYDPVTNKTGFKNGRTFVSIIGGTNSSPFTQGGAHSNQAIVIPPIQCATIDFGYTSIGGNHAGDVLSIDSAMNTKIIIGQIGNWVPGGNLININPHTPGPDGQTIVTDLDLEVNVLLSTANGIVLNANSTSIDHTQITVNEVNLDAGNAIHIPAPRFAVTQNQVVLNRINNCSNALYIAPTTQVRNNTFLIDYPVPPDWGHGKPIYDGTGGLNEIHTLPNAMVVVIASGVNQPLPTGANNWATLNLFRTTQIDALGEFASGSTFTAKTPGYYLAIAQVNAAIPTVAGTGAVGIFKNGSYPIAHSEGFAIVQKGFLSNISGLAYLNTGDSLQVRAWQSSGDNNAVVQVGQDTFFQVMRTR